MCGGRIDGLLLSTALSLEYHPVDPSLLLDRVWVVTVRVVVCVCVCVCVELFSEGG